jgi:hypothetical protein
MAFAISIYQYQGGIAACALATDATAITNNGHELIHLHLVGCTYTNNATDNFLQAMPDHASAEQGYQALLRKSAHLPLLWRGDKRLNG